MAKMDEKDAKKIVDTYQQILKFATEPGKPNQELVDILSSIYAFAYNKGKKEEKEKFIPTNPDLVINDPYLLERCQGLRPLSDEDEFAKKIDVMLKTKRGKNILGERRNLTSDELEAIKKRFELITKQNA